MLNDAKVKAAKPGDKPYKLADSGQLYLFVTPAGGRHWRMNYTYGANAKGKPAQKTLTLGPYPVVSLGEARKKRDDAKALLLAGRDPSMEKKVAVKAQAFANDNTFEAVARAWHTKQKPIWSPIHAKQVLDSLIDNVFPEIGSVPIKDIKAPKLLELLTAVEARGAIETAHRICQRISAVFVYGIAAGVAEYDPAASLGKALKPKPRAKRQPAITDLAEVRTMLTACEAIDARATTKLAMRLIALTVVRPGELRFARWAEIEGIDGPEPLWRIPAARMKGDEERKAEEGGDHLVPLSAQAVDVLRALKQLTGDLDLMFPSDRHVNRAMSENTLRAMLIRAGYYQRHVPHGFRAAFSTIMNEWAKIHGRPDDRATIDLMLAHVPKDKVESAYNRAAFMPRRRELAQEWANQLMQGFVVAEAHLGKKMHSYG